ncbi:biotin synthase [Peptococcaceae bacterium CEB3]|nr:biotin synthase [Peptococcaceae bacterium CEB3]
MKILLINSFQFGRLVVPINVLSLAAALQKENYDVSILDYNYASQSGNLVVKENNIDENLDAMTDLALSYGADLIGLNCICSNYHIFLDLGRRIKLKRPHVKLFLGGPQASITAEETLKACPFVELIGIGECERNICSIVNYLSGKIEPNNIPGIAYRKNGQVVRNAEGALILDFEDLPKLNYYLLPYMDKLEEVDIEGGRGCPFSCKFCSTKTFWKRRFRLKDLNLIIDEIKELKKNYGIKHYNFIHDLFTANKAKILEFCDMLVENNLNIIWTCNSRLDTIDEEIMIRLKEAGCYLVFFGIETGSPRMQKIISKDLDLTELLPKVKMLQKHKIKLVLSFIYGFPEETIEDVRATLSTIRQLQKLNVKVIQIHRFTVLSGTEYYYKYRDKLKFKAN